MMEEQTTPARAQTQRSGPVRLSTINEKVQVASGDLNAASQSADSPHTKTIEPLEITRILPFAAIPDFKTPTASAHPIILKTPSQGCFCIDGPELVEEARQQNRQCILCEIIHARSDSDIDIALHKAAVRSMPPGGTCSYVEMVGNTVRLFKMIMESEDVLEIFSHGGARRGTAYASCREHDAVAILKKRLGRNRKTILKQLEHGAFLNEEALRALVEADMPKGFFEAMQQGKTALVAELETARRPPADIINAVSAKMLFWLTEAQTPVPIEISPIEDSQAVQTTKEKTSRGSRTPKARNFTHWAGNESAVAGTPVNEDHVRGEMKRIAADLLQLSEDSDLAKTAQVEAVRSLTVQLSKLTAHLVHLSTRDGACRGGTV